MNLTFVQDYTSEVSLDNELMGTPSSSLYWNQGVHPLVTISNILAFAPIVSFTFADWNIATTYGKYETSQLQSDIVTYDSKIYQSLTNSNIGNQPDTSSTNWLETNVESLRIKAFIKKIEQNMFSQLHLHRKLVDSQYIYNVGDNLTTLGGNYSGWVIEPKGSDYIKIRINQIALQANTTGTVNLYVINQEQLITTIPLTVNNGLLQFEDIGYEFKGFGRFIFAFDSQEVKSNSPYNDPLKYDGFVMYPVQGIGTTVQSAEYSISSAGNGVSFNISSYLDSSQYITNNLIDFSKFLQAQFEYDLMRKMLSNANNRTNSDERNIGSDPIKLDILRTETFSTDHLTIAKKYNRLLNETKNSISKTFDRFLKPRSGFRVKTGTFV